MTLPLDQLRFLRADGIDPTNLTLEEANELDTLLFRITADCPFGDVEDARMRELKAKAAGQPFVGGFVSATGELPPAILSSEYVLPNDHPLLTSANLTGNITVQEPTGGFITACNNDLHPTQITFATMGKPALIIHADGEIEFTNVTEAALALKAEWDRMRGAW